jgi:hypothetical protein
MPKTKKGHLTMSLLPRLRTRRSWSPESTSRRGLFERSEFPRHLIRGGGGGTLESLLLSKLGGAAHGRKWFWFLLPKQKVLVTRGRNPAYKNYWKKSIRVEKKRRGQEQPGSPITNVGDDRIKEKGDSFIFLRIVSKRTKERQAPQPGRTNNSTVIHTSELFNA